MRGEHSCFRCEAERYENYSVSVGFINKEGQFEVKHDKARGRSAKEAIGEFLNNEFSGKGVKLLTDCISAFKI